MFHTISNFPLKSKGTGNEAGGKQSMSGLVNIVRSAKLNVENSHHKYWILILQGLGNKGNGQEMTGLINIVSGVDSFAI